MQDQSITIPTWTPEDLKAWRKRLKLNQEEAAGLLGISRRAYITREKPESIISTETVLACMYLEEKRRQEAGEGSP
ncbi:helix-turn-helix domain-containing protein [Azospirillum argentinense]